ncbi:MAG: hypothetical protein HY301_04775 [Verrucomicrobia bacterium]|nr:hypothetical protein [Verrucomicrobiota bacterium]
MKPMSHTLHLPLLAVAVVLLGETSEAASRRNNRPRQNPPAQNQNQNPNPQTPTAKPAAPATVAFKDVAMNASFYFASDTNHYFRYTKASATMATSPTGTATPMSPDAQVLPADAAKASAPPKG